MIRRELLLFEKAGPENTDATLEAAVIRSGSALRLCAEPIVRAC